VAAGERECIIKVLRHIAPSEPTGRIWGRKQSADGRQGREGNLWAADPEDLADLIVAELTRERGW
jgi:hypothetical protein